MACCETLELMLLPPHHESCLHILFTVAIQHASVLVVTINACQICKLVHHFPLIAESSTMYS